MFYNQLYKPEQLKRYGTVKTLLYKDQVNKRKNDIEENGNTV